MDRLIPNSSDTSDVLAQRARREAARQEPAFSDELHGRIMKAVKRSGSCESTQDQSTRSEEERIVPRPKSPFGPVWTVAALVVLGIEIAVVVSDPNHAPAPNSLAVSATMHNHRRAHHESVAIDLPQVQRMPQQVTVAMETAIRREQWAGLDRDAKSMTKFLVNQVPFQSTWKN